MLTSRSGYTLKKCKRRTHCFRRPGLLYEASSAPRENMKSDYPQLELIVFGFLFFKCWEGNKGSKWQKQCSRLPTQIFRFEKNRNSLNKYEYLDRKLYKNAAFSNIAHNVLVLRIDSIVFFCLLHSWMQLKSLLFHLIDLSRPSNFNARKNSFFFGFLLIACNIKTKTNRM